MKTTLFRMFLWAVLPLLFFACSGEEQLEPSITIDSSGEYLMDANVNARTTVSFTSTYAWQASTDANWMVISPTKGNAGNTTITILAKEENRTGDIRTGLLTITSEGITKSVSIKQSATEVINVKQSTYTIGEEGGECFLEYSSNIDNAQFTLSEDNLPEWISYTLTQGRALHEGSIKLTIAANKTFEERTAKIQIQAVDANNLDHILLKSPIINIKQQKASVGTSTDFVTGDQKVYQLQKHSKGNGVPIVLMGDGFLDKDIESGYYRQAMEKGMELFFTEEPVHSLREYFDVWMVTAVSQNNAFGGAYSTKFACVLEGNGSTGISGNHDMVATYTRLVPEIGSNTQLFNETMAIVILNTNDYAGTTYFGFSGLDEFAIGYCPIIDNMESENFRRVLCHECIGHGFTKLLDEYSYESQGTIPAAEIENTRRMQKMGWAANVDFTNNRESVLWKNFLNDARYQGKDRNGEELGVYEGACTYWRGAYRPTNESMMRSNMHGFNAPSREAIYKRIMKVAYGSQWQYDYEEFAKFDLAHLPQPRSIETRGTAKEVLPPLPSPKFVNCPLNINNH